MGKKIKYYLDIFGLFYIDKYVLRNWFENNLYSYGGVIVFKIMK